MIATKTAATADSIRERKAKASVGTKSSLRRPLHIVISATTEKEAERILEVLLSKHLIAGGLFFVGRSYSWWKGKLEHKKYFNISAFVIARNRKRIHRDVTPVIAFFKVEDGTPDFLRWVGKESGN